MDFLNTIDYGFYPLSNAKMAAICGVTERTVRNWISGHSKPNKACVDLIILHHRGRIMPTKWPHGWTFNRSGNLDTGHKRAISHNELDWYMYSINLWRHTMDLLPQIEARIDALIKVCPPAEVINLQAYKDEIERFKNRPFYLDETKKDNYDLAAKTLTRVHGC